MKMSVRLSQAQRIKEFPITATKVFMAHAAISPFSRRVCAAIQDYCLGNAVSGQWEYLYADKETKVRQHAAALLGAKEEEIAFVPSTSVGLGIVAGGLPWKRGDNVVVADGDFPANIYPWLNLASIGVETRFIPRRVDGAVYPDDVEKIIDRHTRLVSLSSVNFVTGFRLDIKMIGELLRKRGILFCVDAIQSLGAIPLDTGYFDFAASSSHKWLMGPMGSGVLCVRKEHFDRVRPVLPGWKSVKENKKYLNYNLDYPDSAARFESGSPNGLGLVGLHAALEILIEVGIGNIADRLAGFRQTLTETLAEMGYRVISPNGPCGSGIISFTDENGDIMLLRRYLDSRGYIVSLRDTLDGGKCIRISPHFYNTDDEIAALLDEIRAFQRKVFNVRA
jgi:cysteine desulfurase/selenocysteine lyase